MANKEIAIEYTEEQYFSRNEMSKNIGFQISDLMWKKVTDYRETFNYPLSLKWFGTRKLVLCIYPTFAGKVNQIESKINVFLNESSKLDKTNGSYQHFKLTNLKRCLNELVKKYNADISDSRLTKLIASENPFDQNEDKLVNYLTAIKYIEEKYTKNIDIDFLADLYSKITGVSELTYFYRDRNNAGVNSMAVISRVYDAAPCEYIDEMMNSLFEFIKSSSMPVIEKALLAYQYFIMIKPFRDYNEEMAALLFKAIVSHFSYGELGAYLNIECFLNQKEEVNRKINIEVQSNFDMTYFASVYVSLLETSIDGSIDLVREYSYKEFKQDFYQLDEDTKSNSTVEEKKTTVEETKPVEQVNEEKTNEPEKPIENLQTQSDENEFKNDEQPINVTQSVKVTKSTEGLAINFIPPVLDEKVAQRLEQNLLEMDVLIKKGEAKFYARHCTLGMYYTIDQYKKTIKCVYETARTSMEHLVQLGYYSKKQVGKKFVYTPVERK